jgi:hypothetical protein
MNNTSANNIPMLRIPCTDGTAIRVPWNEQEEAYSSELLGDPRKIAQHGVDAYLLPKLTPGSMAKFLATYFPVGHVTQYHYLSASISNWEVHPRVMREVVYCYLLQYDETLSWRIRRFLSVVLTHWDAAQPLGHSRDPRAVVAMQALVKGALPQFLEQDNPRMYQAMRMVLTTYIPLIVDKRNMEQTVQLLAIQRYGIVARILRKWNRRTPVAVALAVVIGFMTLTDLVRVIQKVGYLWPSVGAIDILDMAALNGLVD